MRVIAIADRKIGEGQPPFIIAEMSANHRKSLARAREIVCAAKDAGADAIKVQTFTPDTITFDSSEGNFLIKGSSPWAGRSLYELYKEAALPWDWHSELQELAKSLGLIFLSTPFDATAVDFLEKLNVPAYKIASFELVDIPLISKAASTGKPLIISTGMASEAEVAEAVSTARKAGATALALLRCVSGYPAGPEDMNLRTIADMETRFNVIAGLSDHSMEPETSAYAVAAGAKIIEKHLTLRRSDGGLDAGFSLEPAEFKAMVKAIRFAEKALGKICYGTGRTEKDSAIFRRSLYAVADIAEGETFTASNVRSIRPADGLHPRHYWQVLTLKAKRAIKAGTPLHPDLIEGFKEGRPEK